MTYRYNFAIIIHGVPRYLTGTAKEHISMIVCFIGHRTVNNAEQVKIKLIDAISSLIADGANTFLFGSRN